MHASSLLAVFAVVGFAAAQGDYAVQDPQSTEEASASAPVYPVSSNDPISTVEASASAPVYDPISTVEASASAPVYPIYSSAAAGFNFSRPTVAPTRFQNTSFTTSCTDPSYVPSATDGTSVVVVPTGGVPVITEEQSIVVPTYPASLNTEQASTAVIITKVVPSVIGTSTVMVTITSTVSACTAATVTVTGTTTVTITATPNAPVENAAPSAPVDNATPSAPADDASPSVPIITLEQAATVPVTTEEQAATVPAAYPSVSTEEADATVPAAYSTEEADAVLPTSTRVASVTVLPLPTKGSVRYQNASASVPAYTGPSYEGGAVRYSKAGFTMVAVGFAAVAFAL